MTKKITSQRDLEQFARDLFQANGKQIVCQLKTLPKRYIVYVDGREVSYCYPEQFKAYNAALKISGIPGAFTYKWNAKKDCPEWTFKDA